MERPLRLLLAAAALLTLAGALTACLDDDDGGANPVDMATVWPHADGASWSYHLDYARHEVPGIPPGGLPSLERLRAELLTPVAADASVAGSALYDLALDGTVTTASGVTAQRMVETITPLDGDPIGAAAPRDARLLRQVARARPDLRARIGAMLGEDLAAKGAFARIDPPFLLGGYAFAYEDSGYYGYGDVDAAHTRVYLQAPLLPGTTCSLQPLPSLADDIWLHVRVWSVGWRSQGGVSSPQMVEVLYVLDLGEQEAVDETGEVLVRTHAYQAALVWYAPGIGPVAARERHVLGPVPVLQDEPGTLIVDFACRLEAATVP